MGAAARIFGGIAFAEQEGEFGRLPLTNWCGYADQSYGRGLIAFAMHQFKELQPLESKCYAALETSYRNAASDYKMCIAKLRTLCNCTVCGGLEPAGETSAEYVKPFCLPLLTETIIRLVWTLSLLSF